MYLRSGKLLNTENTQSSLYKTFSVFSNKYEYDVYYSNKYIKLDDDERNTLLNSDSTYLDLYKLNDSIIEYEIRNMDNFLELCGKNIDKLRINCQYYINWKNNIIKVLDNNYNHIDEIESEIRNDYYFYADNDDIEVLECSKNYFDYIGVIKRIQNIKNRINKLKYILRI